MSTPQEQAGDILRGMRGETVTEVPHPGEPPSTKGLNDEAARRTLADHDAKLQAHLAYLNSKPSSHLTQAEQRTLWQATMKALRDGE